MLLIPSLSIKEVKSLLGFVSNIPDKRQYIHPYVLDMEGSFPSDDQLTSISPRTERFPIIVAVDEEAVRAYHYHARVRKSTSDSDPLYTGVERNCVSFMGNAWERGESNMLRKAQEVGQILDEEQLAFLADPRIPSSQAQTVIPHNAAFQTEDLDTYDSDCDDLSTAQCCSEILCATCNKSIFDGVPDKCLLDLVQNGNNRTKSAKKHKKQNIWKPTGHVFTEAGFKWKPTGRTFTIVGNSCPLP
ncbi:hypothetical protein Tco_1129229, partial [Tanacetum coccineum]